MRRYILASIFIFSFMFSQGQINTFDSVMNNLQFHVFTDNVDTCVLPFLKRCVPVLAEKLKPTKGGWTMYPPEPMPTPKDGLVSIKVPQHPSLYCNHSGARFDILTQEWEGGRPGVKAVRVWFYFDRKADADTALKKLVERFKAANTKTTIVRQSRVQTVLLYEMGKDAWQKAKLTLQKRKDHEPKYSILLSYGSDNGEPW